LFTFIDALLKGPKWHCMIIQTEGYITIHSVYLIWHDALKVMHHIFGNLAFTKNMKFDPYEIYNNEEQKYSE
ncbi:uncharacterized protein F5147DRAFT_576546, partial [Suillus discolor]